MYSIRDRLLWTFAIVVLLTGIAATYMTFISARGQVDSLLDMQLKQVAISLESHVAAEQRIQRQIERNEEQFVVQWIDRETQRVHVSHKITPFPYSEQTGFSTIRHDGETWRLYTLVADKTIIVSAQPTDIRVGLAFSSALHILQPLVLLLPFLAIAVWLVVGLLNKGGFREIPRTEEEAQIVATVDGEDVYYDLYRCLFRNYAAT